MCKMKSYKLTVSENQLRVMMIALEDYFRTRMGQFSDLADDLAFCGFDYSQPFDADREKDFYARIDRRDDCQDLMRQAHGKAQPRLLASDYYNKTPDMISAIDLWHVIKHHWWKENPNRKDWTVDAYPPHPESDEPLMIIEPIEERAEQ